MVFQTISIEIISGDTPGHFRTDIPLHSRNVLVLYELWHGTISCIKIYPSCGNTSHSHYSLHVFHSHNNRRHCRVWRQQNKKYHAKSIQFSVKSLVSVQVSGAISSRGLFLLRKENGNKNNAKYQSDIIHVIKMTCECVVFPQKAYAFMHGLTPCHNSKRTITFLECRGIPIPE